MLLNNVIQIPVNSDEGLPRVTKVVPFTAPDGWAGIAANKLKYVELQDEIVTVDQFDEAHEKWLADREAAK